MLRDRNVENSRPLEMDHCRFTGEFRYMFCNNCNTRAKVARQIQVLHKFENFDCAHHMDGISQYVAEATEKYREEDEADAKRKEDTGKEEA